jgi:hypothetical protein
MRANFGVSVLLLTLMMSAPVHAEPPKVAVFDLELIDTSAEGDTGRLSVGDSGKFQVLDIAPVSAAAQGSNLQACGGCDVQLALKLGADLAMTGWCKRSLPSFSTSASTCATPIADG